MLLYYLRLAFKSIRKSPIISLITITAIALGITVATTILSLRYVLAANPIPEKSDQLFNVRLESWETDSEFFGPAGEPPKHITYKDMAGIRASDIPTYQSGVGKAAIFAFPDDNKIKPFRAQIRLCHPDFFPMFNVPFRYGGGWTQTADQSRDRVTVLSDKINQKLFNGRDSIGESIRLGSERFTVIGVLAPFRPTPQYYDALNNMFSEVCDFFVPFDLIREASLGLSRRTQSDSFGGGQFPDPESVYTQSEVHWIQYWVQLEDQPQLASYKSFIDDYARGQKKLGRFPRPLNNRVTPVMEWMEFNQAAPPALRGMVILALLFLVVCALNLMGLLLGKFLAKANLVGVRRALGASKAHIFVQHISECLLVGMIGGLLGVAMSHQALRFINKVAPPGNFHENVFRLDLTMLAMALGLSFFASLIAGIYPAWRACNIAPAVQIKLQ